LIKPGDSWNGVGLHLELVGKRLCYTCIAKIFRTGQPGSGEPPEVPEAILIVSTAMIFLTALLVRIDPTIPGLLFAGSLGFVALERELKNRFSERRASEAWKTRKLSEPLVSIDTLFEEHSM
jgi:hypothetical protein